LAVYPQRQESIKMKFGSVCSGIEAASCAWHPLGWRSQWLSEIESFPSRVLEHHYPTVPNLGDMTKFKEWPDAAIDLLVGGTPCQSFSVAGLRKGLADPRGNLMLTYLAIAERYAPRWLVWENVPGVLSSNGGRDFGTLLGGLAELGYGFAYRVLDAQFFGVAQRRRRVFVVANLGDWRRAAAVLFERESLLGHPAPRRESREGVAPTLSARTKGGGGLGTDFECDGGLLCADIAPTLNAAFGKKQGLENQHIDGGCGLFVAHSLRGEGFDASEDGTGRGTPLVPVSALNWQAGGKQTTLGGGPVSSALVKEQIPGVQIGAAVRRLTPRECERLQGFPDDYTAITVRGKAAADGPRYKALGNSMAVPVMRWIGERIELVESTLSQQKAA
jgi:DNA (cytosine-5)-methyltransferase 1